MAVRARRHRNRCKRLKCTNRLSGFSDVAISGKRETLGTRHVGNGLTLAVHDPAAPLSALVEIPWGTQNVPMPKVSHLRSNYLSLRPSDKTWVRNQVSRLARLWGMPSLAVLIQFEISNRLTKSLGQCRYRENRV